MKLLQQYIADIDHPVFILSPASDEIRYANKMATEKAGVSQLIGSPLSSSLHRCPHTINGKSYGQFNAEWYEVVEREITSDQQPVLIIELLPRKEVPFSGFFESWKNMVEVMLHRLRSPMTGITGYLELIEVRNDQEKLEKPLSSIQKGFDYIFDIMDELEALYQLETRFDDEKFSHVSLEKVIKTQIANLTEEAQQRISIANSDDNITPFTDAGVVQNIIFHLLENAVRHSSGPIDVTITDQAPVTITISNNATDIDPAIAERVFFPFVTSRADDLGIGATIALIYAKQIGGTLFFEVKDDKVSASLTFPFA